MFELDELKELYKGVVYIQELIYDELWYFFEFLYCVEIFYDVMVKYGCVFLIVVDKYDILVLSKVCEVFICFIVFLFNVLEVLELVIFIYVIFLKEIVLNVILESYEDVVFLKEYEDFVMQNVFLLVEIIKVFIKDFKKQIVIFLRL